MPGIYVEFYVRNVIGKDAMKNVDFNCFTLAILISNWDSLSNAISILHRYTNKYDSAMTFYHCKLVLASQQN